MFDSIRDPLNDARDEAKQYFERQGHRPKTFTVSNFSIFFGNIPGVLNLLRKEPEILAFAIFQWLVVWAAYLAWVQMLHWIPDQLWDAVRSASEDNRKNAFALVNLALLGWTFLIVMVASYPIGLCNAAMVAVHDLRTTGQEVTIARCLAIADRHLGRIWLFTAIDGWITVRAILGRLPKKHNHRTALDELLYYAWKVATMGVVPALVNGRDFVAAGRDSIRLLESEPQKALGLRLGYSAVCWIVGIASYVFTFFVLRYDWRPDRPHYIYDAYLLAAIPVFVAVGIVTVLIRPIYLLSVARFYSDANNVAGEVNKDITSVPGWLDVFSSGNALCFCVTFAVVFVAVLFSDQIGLTGWIAGLADRDLASYGLP
ncbi:MAG TPA: DUF6159 family protein [Micropepsaceae bacterium]|nr:DUF6159 family protein [Micropepsaceae bacterium]